MMKKFRGLFYTVTLLCSIAMTAHADIYKHVDANGRVYYSDTPTEGGKPMELPPINTMEIPKPIEVTAPPAIQAEVDHEYNSVDIVSPNNEDTIRAVDSFYVTVETDPDLHDSDQVVLLLNGKEQSRSDRYLSFLVSALERGTYVFEAQIRDKQNNILKNSSIVTVYVKRNSILTNPLSKKVEPPPPTGTLPPPPPTGTLPPPPPTGQQPPPKP
jgi:hypothetical protein